MADLAYPGHLIFVCRLVVDGHGDGNSVSGAHASRVASVCHHERVPRDQGHDLQGTESLVALCHQALHA